MKILKSNVSKIIIAFLIFPVVLMLVGLVIKKSSVTSIWQGVGDLIVFVLAYLLNRQYFQQKIYWFNQHNLSKQFTTSLPAIIIVAFLNSPVLTVADFQVKFRVIVVCLLVGLAEEYIFRGLLLSLFLELFHKNVYGAVIASSALFGLLHLINLKALSIGYVSSQVLFAMALGIIFGTIYVKTHNLSIVILLHALRDMFPMFSDKMMAEAAHVEFSVLSLYGMGIFLVIALFISYIQLRDFKIED
ncbi:immunity protein PlnP [Companilactobacillus mindensis DSM 14500]|uniref:Immunity protein PlnP n=1 Tax=Companilactobacillus mindensis DSM 14500 TaxID=1423770 RepID=A0A0R1QDT5_9LACO|nr:CPBP family intramembrane glutamic endopeptidase [Companilactobacillus mindensis]KRL42877.1 immunity protein PlnP [Companilactobacillus mindensis DSM 14500]GEO78480.1 CAAX amino protease [Companilactobacillus mindensis]